ncbi:MAG TPA: zf-HC2 domain-containing protein [Steroidobacteraceae bacterium]
MTHGHRTPAAREHQDISALLPWYVNGSIDERDRQRLDAHLALCAGCRDELAREQWIYEGMTAETAVEYMPAASLKRLQARLDGVAAASPDPRADVRTHELAAGQKPGGGPLAWPGLMAASVAVMAVALSLLAADRWMQFRAHAAVPDYHTVTTSTPRPQGEVIRAVFSPTITLVELQAVLDEAQLRIVSGPTEAGVYSLAANSGRPVSASLASLRRDEKVRFAEITSSSSGPGDIQ